MLGYLLVTHPVCLFFAVQVCWLEPPRLEQSSSTLQREGLYSTVHGAPAKPTATPSNLTLKVSLMTDIYTLGFISAKDVLCSFLALQFKRNPSPRGLDAANQFIHSLKQTIFFCLLPPFISNFFCSTMRFDQKMCCVFRLKAGAVSHWHNAELEMKEKKELFTS